MLSGAALIGARAGAADIVQYEVYYGPVPAKELRELRGGIRIAGLDLNFGAVVRTLVNGILAAETQIVLNNDGTFTQNTIMGGPLPAGVSISPFIQSGPVGLKGFKIDKEGSPTSSFALFSVGLDRTKSVVANTIGGTPGSPFSVNQQVTTNLTIHNFDFVRSTLLSQAAAGAAAAAGAPDAMAGFGR